MAIEEDAPRGVPEWVVTYGDMMSLLLTFFIMLVSMSELKEEERFQAMLESIRRQFGYESSPSVVLPGEVRPANSSLSIVASMGRAKRLDLARGGQTMTALSGDHPLVQTIRPGASPTVGGVIFFPETGTELSEEHQANLRRILGELRGKPQKIEIRGHSSRKPPDPHLPVRDSWDLGYARAYNAMQYLIGSGIEPERIRIGSAGAFEALDKGVDAASRERNARVEILVWDEFAGPASE